MASKAAAADGPVDALLSFWELPLDIKICIASLLSPEDKARLALTCKAAAEDILGNNAYWKHIVWMDSRYSRSSCLADMKPEWTFDSLLLVSKCPLDVPTKLVQRAKHSVLWCGRLNRLIGWLSVCNQYRGPTSPLNLSKKAMEYLPAALREEAHGDKSRSWSSESMQAFAQGRATGKLPDSLIAFPCSFLPDAKGECGNASRTSFLDSEVYPGVSSVRLVNKDRRLEPGRPFPSHQCGRRHHGPGRSRP